MLENSKLNVTQEKRYLTIEKIFSLIQKEFEGTEVTAAFTKKLLKDAIETIDVRALYIPLHAINNKITDKKVD